MARKKRKVVATALCGLCMAAGCWAGGAQADDELVLPEVTVTANKVREDLQKVPSSVSVMNEDEVRESGVNTLGDLSSRIPNLTIPTGGLSIMQFPTLRGAASIAHSYVPSVITYIDDVPLTNTSGYDAQLYNIESIEVLRGPQGTLYGRNASGGVIKITTKKPSNDPHGEIGFEYGNKQHVKTTVALSGPVVKDVLFANGSFQFFSQRGEVMNDYNGQYIDDKKNYTGRLGFRLTPTDDLDINFQVGMTKYDEGTFGMYSPNSFSQYESMMPGMTQGMFEAAGGTTQKRHVNSNDPGFNKSAHNEQALSVKYDISPNWTFTSVTTRSEYDIDFDIDYDFTPNLLGDSYGMEDHNKSGFYDFGQEFRLAYDKDGMNAVMGLAYANTDRRIRYDYYMAGFPKVDARDITNSYALFGQVKLPFAERWALTLGGRFDYYNTTTHSDLVNMTGATSYRGSDSWTNFSPKVALEYALTDKNMVYASFSEGYKAGGLAAAYATAGHEKYDEEHVYAFEIGSKNLFLQDRLRLNAALFANKYNGMQVEMYTAGMSGFIQNAGNPWALGAEVEATYALLPNLELFASAGYTHLRFDNIVDEFYGDLNNNHVPYVPEWTYSAGLSYRHESGFYTRWDVTGATKAYLNTDNSGHIPSHTLVNARIGYEIGDFDIYGYVNNMFDKRYDYVGSFGGAYWVATEGIGFGGGVTYRF